MPRGLTVPEPGTTLYKICPKCDVSHSKCDSSCVWFRQAIPTTPCNIISDGYEMMVVEIKYHDGWRISDLNMIGEKYFLTYEDAANMILSMNVKEEVGEAEGVDKADDAKSAGHEFPERGSIAATFVEAAKLIKNMDDSEAGKRRKKQIMPPRRLFKKKPRYNKPQKSGSDRRISEAYEHGRQAGKIHASLFESGRENDAAAQGDLGKTMPTDNRDWGLPRFGPHFPQNNS